MKKIVFPIFLGLTFILIIVGLSGCLGSVEEIAEIDKFVGIWNRQAAELWHELAEIPTITFFSNRTFTTNKNTSGTYKLEEEKLVLTFDDGSRTLLFSYQFSDANKKLYLIDSNEIAAEYIK